MLPGIGCVSGALLSRHQAAVAYLFVARMGASRLLLRSRARASSTVLRGEQAVGGYSLSVL